MRTLTGNHVITAENAAEYADVGVIEGYARIYADCPALTSVGGYARIYADCPALTSVGGNANIHADCPALTSVEGYARIHADCPALTSVGGHKILPEAEQIKYRRLVVAHVLNEAELDMSGWGVENGKLCGTTACMGGWAQVEAPDGPLKRVHPSTAGVVLLGTKAAAFFHKDNEAAREWAKGWA